jgi:hypothetical protein
MYSSNCQSIRNSLFSFNHHNIEKIPRPIMVIWSSIEISLFVDIAGEIRGSLPLLPIPFREYRLREQSSPASSNCETRMLHYFRPINETTILFLTLRGQYQISASGSPCVNSLRWKVSSQFRIPWKALAASD